jgi:hypothetical protein
MGLHVTVLSSHQRTALTCVIPIPSGFEVKIQNAFLGSYMCYMPCPFHPTLFNHANNIS